MKFYLLGLFTIPVGLLTFWIVSTVFYLVRCAIRDAYRILRHGLTPGSRLRWIWVPFVAFYYCFVDQFHAWLRGNRLEVIDDRED